MCVVGQLLESEFSHFLSESVLGNIHWFCLEVPLVIVVRVIWQLKNAKNLHLKCIRIFRNQGKNPFYVDLISFNIQQIIFMYSVYDNTEQSVKAKVLRDNE